MIDRRIAIVSRSFWPFCGGTELVVANLLKQIRLAGAKCQLVTSQWEPGTSQEFEFGEVPCVRIPRLAAGVWAAGRYVKAAASALRDRCAGWDAVLVSGSSEELDAALRAKHNGGPGQVWLRLDANLYHRLLRSPATRKKIASLCGGVDRLIASEASLCQPFAEWLGQPGRVEGIPDGVDYDPFITPHGFHDRGPLKESLSEIHPLLQIQTIQPLAITAVEFQGDPGVHRLVEAWLQVAHRRPDARLWIVGDGLQAREVWQQINDLDLVQQVVLVGNFDHLIDPYLAADLYLHPGGVALDTTPMTQAAACAVPSLLPRTVKAPAWFTPGQTGWVIEEGSVTAWGNAIADAIQDREGRRQRGQEARQRVLQEQSWSQIMPQWSALLDRISEPEGTAIRES